MYEYLAHLVKVVDADTLHVTVDCGFDVHLGMTLRLYGVDAPETSTEEGKKAKTFAEDWFRRFGPDFFLSTVKDKKEKYGRYLGTCYDLHQTECLNVDLVTNGHARPYYGGAR